MAKQVLIDTNTFDDYVKDVLVTQKDVLCSKKDVSISSMLTIGLWSAGALAHLRELIYGKEEN